MITSVPATVRWGIKNLFIVVVKSQAIHKNRNDRPLMEFCLFETQY